jgi:hypothetical protein
MDGYRALVGKCMKLMTTMHGKCMKLMTTMQGTQSMQVADSITDGQGKVDCVGTVVVHPESQAWFHLTAGMSKVNYPNSIHQYSYWPDTAHTTNVRLHNSEKKCDKLLHST